MADITLKNLGKIYPNGFVSVKDVSLKIKDKELVTFYGPHGCGKSTILRMIGGLESITSGEIWLDDELLSNIPPRDRPLAMAFQNYKLYKELNVHENIALGLKLRKLPRPEIEFRVKKAAVFLGISELMSKKVRKLSEIDRQRVALGRALVCHPKVFLIDEDFSRQNEMLRVQMLSDLRRMHEELDMTILYVTNNYEEAVKYGTTIVLMKDGEITDIRDKANLTDYQKISPVDADGNI
ncbi:ABC transporter ATP-binding protein [Hespellia stercorisuis]|uniref:Carbohydrate ABC transporter ATP-binding protein, CUT1 family (TC 3.A.1.1.-) n=1 Tax=Hespellia stercorisuis DSM 15480 TaxID=1121950 RepID=A0A1M6JEL8_9FIRM|nr:ATP-binding cassette domain-containing protein [Hespellia stercorisuis]SHJ45094.1 carbohydrate ABC transporter ATP-binding protein, CUT1 family (TC 3.A.1.1.-) [Hespellia stercorisuis DSM 15480]